MTTKVLSCQELLYIFKPFWVCQTSFPSVQWRVTMLILVLKCIIQGSYDICFVKIILRHNLGEKFKQQKQGPMYLSGLLCLAARILEFGPPLINAKFLLTIYMSMAELWVLSELMNCPQFKFMQTKSWLWLYWSIWVSEWFEFSWVLNLEMITFFKCFCWVNKEV